jgi:glucokinase
MGSPTAAYDRDFVLGIDFGGTKIALATADSDGAVIESAVIATNAPDGAGQAVDRAIAQANELIALTAERTGRACGAVGAVSPGIVYPDRVLLAPNVPGWGDLALRDRLRDGLGVARVEVGTDAKAAALAESRWGSLRGADPALFLSLGTGVAAAMVVGGRVVSGANGASGEIAYSLLGHTDSRGAADGRAPLEELVSGRAIGERGSRLLGGTLTAADVFASDDPRARLLIAEALAELAVHVANIAILIDPARIAVGGGLMSHGDLVLAALGQRLSFAAPFPPELVPAHFVHDGSLRGALVLALDSATATSSELGLQPQQEEGP